MKYLTISLLFFLIAGCSSASKKESQISEIPHIHVDVGPVPEPVRAEVSQLISKLKSESEIIFHGDGKIENPTINRLCEIGQPAVGQIIDSYYETLNSKHLIYFRYIILDTLKRMQQPVSLPFIRQIAWRGDRRERRVACEAIWTFGDYRCVDTLINALEDEDTEVVDTAAAGLRAITGFSFGLYPNVTPRQRKEAIKKWQHWWSVTGGSFPSRRHDTK